MANKRKAPAAPTAPAAPVQTAPPTEYQTPGVESLLLLEVNDVLADDNSRYGIRDASVESLATDIEQHGGIIEPLEVSVIEGATAIPHYRLNFGFRRYRAAEYLNREKNAGVMLPCRVHDTPDNLSRLRRQVSENLERESFSPMDKATAIKRLMDEGVTRQEVRRIFSTIGGRKGLKVQAASNSFVNIMLNLLELPKAIQTDIHNGIIGVAAAYELGKVPADKRQTVVDRAKRDYFAQLDAEEKDEQKLLTQEKKLADAEAEATLAHGEIEAAEQAVTKSQEDYAAKVDVLRSRQRDPLGDGRAFPELKEAEKKRATEAIKAAEEDVKGAGKAVKDTTEQVDKIKVKAKKANDTAEKVRKMLEDARKPGVKKPKVSAAGVKDAAKAEGVTSQPVPLTAKDMHQVVDDWAGGQVCIPRVAALGKIIKECFDGITTPKMMMAGIYKYLGLTMPVRDRD
jgi:ParB/RepB/Spo0J family partition protein